MAITPERCRRWNSLALVLVALIALLPVVSVAAGQGAPQKKPRKDYALIFGTVFGPDGRSRYGVPVKIRRAGQKKAFWEGYSDHAGEFAARVPPGAADYVVWADIKTKKGEPKPEARVHVDNDERVDVGLHLKE